MNTSPTTGQLTPIDNGLMMMTASSKAQHEVDCWVRSPTAKNLDKEIYGSIQAVG